LIGINVPGPLGGPAWPAPRLAAGYETYRRMRRDPTIALARALAVAPVVAGKRTVEADADVPEEVRGWIDKQFLTVREPLLETILKHGYVDFGHQGFELIWGLDADGRQYVARFKPLLPDVTEILIDDHGGLAGLRQRGKGDGSNSPVGPEGASHKLDLSPFPRQKDVVLTGTSAMLVSFGGEGSNLYGEPLLENVREVWNDWRRANEVAARYDRKIAGAYLVLHYPSFGQGIDQNGAKLDNVYLAQRILDKLEAASGVAIGDVPSELAPGQDPNQTAWRLEVQGSAGGQQQGFVDRLRYLDSLKVRGMLLPERAILEGQHGTLAESQSQGDLALLQAELVHHHLTREINRQAVDPVLEANWGPAYRGKVRLEAAPLSDANQGFLRQLVTQALADPKDFADLFRRADWPSIFDAVGLPQTKASSAAPTARSAILSAIGQLQREALEGGDDIPTARRPRTNVAAQAPHAHTEADAADAIGLAGYDPSQPRDALGRWSKDGSSKAPAAVTGLMDVVDPTEGPANQELQKARDKGEQHAKKGFDDLKDAIKKVYEEEPKAFKKGWKSTRNPFSNEYNGRILKRNMRAKGTLAEGEESHHIVQCCDRRAKGARDLLDYYQIDTNGAENGVSLSHAEHTQSWLQKGKTIKLVTSELRDAEGSIRPRPGSLRWEVNRQDIIDRLAKLAREIKAGDFPPGNPRFVPPMN
jgi:hypothetical protein